MSKNDFPSFWMYDTGAESRAQTPGAGEDARVSLRTPLQAQLLILGEPALYTFHQCPIGVFQVAVPHWVLLSASLVFRFSGSLQFGPQAEVASEAALPQGLHGCGQRSISESWHSFYNYHFQHLLRHFSGAQVRLWYVSIISLSLCNRYGGSDPVTYTESIPECPLHSGSAPIRMKI